jgi:hypothetical protein
MCFHIFAFQKIHFNAFQRCRDCAEFVAWSPAKAADQQKIILNYAAGKKGTAGKFLPPLSIGNSR